MKELFRVKLPLAETLIVDVAPQFFTIHGYIWKHLEREDGDSEEHIRGTSIVTGKNVGFFPHEIEWLDDDNE